jgi:Spy/CpxP family protein refolding chaperone
MKAALNLTADQKAKLASIRQSVRQQIAAVNADTSLSATQKAAKIQQIRQSARQQMDAVLTPAQKSSLQGARQHRAVK